MLCTEKPNKLVYYNPKSNEAELTARRWSQCPMNMKHITFVVDTLYLEGYSGYLNMVLSELAPYYRTRIKKISFVVIRSALLSKHTMKNYYIGTILILLKMILKIIIFILQLNKNYLVLREKIKILSFYNEIILKNG